MQLIFWREIPNTINFSNNKQHSENASHQIGGNLILPLDFRAVVAQNRSFLLNSYCLPERGNSAHLVSKISVASDVFHKKFDG